MLAQTSPWRQRVGGTLPKQQQLQRARVAVAGPAVLRLSPLQTRLQLLLVLLVHLVVEELLLRLLNRRQHHGATWASVWPTSTNPWPPPMPLGAWGHAIPGANQLQRPRQSRGVRVDPLRPARPAIRAGRLHGQQPTRTLHRRGVLPRSWRQGGRCFRARGRSMCPTMPRNRLRTPLFAPQGPRLSRHGQQQHWWVHRAGMPAACPARSRQLLSAPRADRDAFCCPAQSEHWKGRRDRRRLPQVECQSPGQQPPRMGPLPMPAARLALNLLLASSRCQLPAGSRAQPGSSPAQRSRRVPCAGAKPSVGWTRA